MMPEDGRKVVVQRWRLVSQLDRILEVPMAVLGLIWAILLVIELLHGAGPVLAAATYTIWGLFLVDFLLRFVLAPRKVIFLRHNVLTMLSLALPAMRLLRVARLLTVVRGIRLVRVLTSLNRGIRSVRRASRARGVGYVVGITALVTVVGAAGMYAFERGAAPGFATYGDALWWTAMLMTSIASEYWPRTAEGRILGLVLSVYGLGLFSYFTAMLASFFIGKDTREGRNLPPRKPPPRNPK